LPLVRDAIDAELYRIGPPVNRLRALLAKLEPEPEGPVVMPFPLPLPSLLYRKLKGGCVVVVSMWDRNASPSLSMYGM
jgi:hypothetical protein